jgi:hypothetical protein
MPLGIFALGQLSVAMCSCITFSVSWPTFYEVARVSALFFTTLGLWLVLISTASHDSVTKGELILGSFFMALAVGCRPNYVFFLLLIPVILWDEVKKIWYDKKKILCLCTCFIVPCAIVASGLMWYNYIRFESMFEFGINYHITSTYVKWANSKNPLSKINGFLVCLYCYLVPSFNVRSSFPFIFLKPVNIGSAYNGYIFNAGTVGILSLPITWFIFGISSVKKFISNQKYNMMLKLIITMTCLGFLQIAVIGPHGTSYLLDILWLFIFTGLFCAYFIYEKLTDYQFAKLIELKTTKFVFNMKGFLLNVITLSMILSNILFFMVTLSSSAGNLIWNNNPLAFYFIQRLLGLDTL